MRTGASCRQRLIRAATLAAVLLCTAPLVAQETAGESEIATAPVELDGTALFTVRGVSSLPAAERARLIEDRLTAVAADPARPVDSLHIVEIENAARIMAGDRMIMGVTSADASFEQVSIRDLATAHMARLREAIVGYREARSPVALRTSAINVVSATAVLVVTAFALFWFYRWFDRLLTSRLATRIQTVGIQSFEVMRAERIWSALRNALVALRTLTLLALVLVYAGFVLAQFPRTRGLSRGMLAFALGPLQVISNGLIANIPSLVFLVVLFFVFRLQPADGSALLRRRSSAAPSRSRISTRSGRCRRTRSSACDRIAFGLIVAYPYIPGLGVGRVQGRLAFPRRRVLARLVVGDLQHHRRLHDDVPARVQESATASRSATTIGDVIEMRLQVTHLRSLKNEEVVIPNSQILDERGR